MVWILELRRAGCIYSGTSPAPGIYEYQSGREVKLTQINVSSPLYGKEWNRFGWLIGYNIPNDWEEPPYGNTWKVPDGFSRYSKHEIILQLSLIHI